eukprot:g11499.t1
MRSFYKLALWLSLALLQQPVLTLALHQQEMKQERPVGLAAIDSEPPKRNVIKSRMNLKLKELMTGNKADVNKVTWVPDAAQSLQEMVVWALAVNKKKTLALDDPDRWGFRLVPLPLTDFEWRRRQAAPDRGIFVPKAAKPNANPPAAYQARIDQASEKGALAVIDAALEADLDREIASFPTVAEELWTLPVQEYVGRELQLQAEQRGADIKGSETPVNLMFKNLGEPTMNEVVAAISIGSTNRCMGPPVAEDHAAERQRFALGVQQLADRKLLESALELDLALELRARYDQPSAEGEWRKKDELAALQKPQDYAFLTLKGEQEQPLLVVGHMG